MLGNTKILGVFGHPVSHSLSPLMQNAAIEALNIDYIYVPFHVLPENLEQAVQGVRALNIAGVNVTIPHKEQIIQYLDEVSEYSKQIRSVNTVINDNGRLKGDTTDGLGFLKSAEAQWGKIDGSRVLVLGAGGAAKAICFALARVGCNIVIANRTLKRAEELSEGLQVAYGSSISRAVGLQMEVVEEEIRQVDMVVNTTSVGMYPGVSETPLPSCLLRSNLMVYDLIYNPLKTRLVGEAQAKGARAMTGLKMLVYQGALSLEMWTGRKIPVDVMEEALIKHFGKGSK